MPAGKYDFYVEQGVESSITILYKDPAANPKDLTGFVGKAQIKKNPWDKVAIAEMVVDVVVPTNGEVQVTLPSNALDNFDFDNQTLKEKYKTFYDVVLTNENTDESIRLLQGACYISPGVTR